MKYLFLLIAIALLSCSRNGTLLNNGEPEISFDLNGRHYEHKGQAASAVKNAGNLALPTHYIIKGFTNSSNNIFIWISTDSLKSISYHLTTGINGIAAEGSQYIFL